MYLCICNRDLFHFLQYLQYLLLFKATDFIPVEALSKVAEIDLKCQALWSVTSNQVGATLTLFWPTDISDENSEKLKNLTDEERKFITQNPALLEFILNQKRIKNQQDQPEIKVSYIRETTSLHVREATHYFSERLKASIRVGHKS